MKGKRHSPEHIIAKLPEADAPLASGATIGQVCQKPAIAEQTVHRRRNQYGGMKVKDAQRLKQLEQENARLASFGINAHCSSSSACAGDAIGS